MLFLFPRLVSFIHDKLKKEEPHYFIITVIEEKEFRIIEKPEKLNVVKEI